MLGSSLLIVSGYQAILMHNLSLNLSERIGIFRSQGTRRYKGFILPRGITLSLVLLLAGIFLWAKVFLSWQSSGFESLDYGSTMKVVIPGATLISLSLETLIFFLFQSWVQVETNN